MHFKSKFILISFVLGALLSLISCATTKPNLIEPTLVFSTAPSSFTPSTLIHPTATYTPTPTSIPSKFVLPSPTEILSPIFHGRVLFEGDATKNDFKSHGFVILNVETKESILVFKDGQEINGRSVSLHYPNPNVIWSPDGHWFAFVGTDASTEESAYPYQDIYIANSDGTIIRRLTDNPQYQKFYLSWSPDEKYILVAMGISGSDLYLVDSSSGVVVKRLTSSGDSYTAAWSPDGKRIAFGNRSGFSILDLADETSQFISVLSGSSRVEDISWSPNSEQIAFVASVLGSNCKDIFEININTGGSINLTSSEQNEKSPVWLPDGKRLVFSRSANTCNIEDLQNDWSIYITNFNREEQKIVSNVNSWSSVAWAPVPNLEIGKQYTLTELGANLNLRTEPSLNGKILEKLPAGEVISVLDGYVDIDDYYWWKIQTKDGIEGWAVEVANWYKPLTE